jgi:hypothetical protein
VGHSVRREFEAALRKPSNYLCSQPGNKDLVNMPSTTPPRYHCTPNPPHGNAHVPAPVMFTIEQRCRCKSWCERRALGISFANMVPAEADKYLYETIRFCNVVDLLSEVSKDSPRFPIYASHLSNLIGPLLSILLVYANIHRSI